MSKFINEIRDEYNKICDSMRKEEDKIKNDICETEKNIKDKVYNMILSKIISILKEEDGREKCTELLTELLKHKDFMDMFYDKVIEEAGIYLKN